VTFLSRKQNTHDLRITSTHALFKGLVPVIWYALVNELDVVPTVILPTYIRQLEAELLLIKSTILFWHGETNRFSLLKLDCLKDPLKHHQHCPFISAD
jgi:hypothetical protein